MLDVPSPAHIPSLVESFAGHPFYSKFCSKRETADRSEPMVHVVIHLCGKGVLEDEQYKAFMRVFPEDTHVRQQRRTHTCLLTLRSTSSHHGNMRTIPSCLLKSRSTSSA